MKMLIYNCFQFGSNNLLGYPIYNSRNAQWTHFTVSFRNQYFSYRFGKIAPTRHPVPQRVQIFAWVLSDLLNAYSVNTCRTFVCFHLLESFVYLQPTYRLRPVLFIKNHPQFSLSCYTINQLTK